MNLDIETDRVLMRAEWHRMIDDWVARYAMEHAKLAAVDLTLRHDEQEGDRVDAVARVGGRTVRATAAGTMPTALRDALDTLQRQLVAPLTCTGVPAA